MVSGTTMIIPNKADVHPLDACFTGNVSTACQDQAVSAA
jgi:hypothetical protein